jgi:hypothetical protein
MDRFGIWQKIDRIALECLSLSLEASLSVKENKREIIKRLRLHIETIKHLCRLSKDLNIIELKKYISLQEKLETISKMASGWEKYIK